MEYTGYCPRCGIKINVRESSLDTAHRCEWCGFKFIIREQLSSTYVQRSRRGCFSTGCVLFALGLLIAGGVAGVAVWIVVSSKQ